MFTANKNVRGTAEDNAILNLGDDYGKRSRQKKRREEERQNS